jgi:hypothetical protein
VDCKGRIRELCRHSVYDLILPRHSRSVTEMSHLGELASVGFVINEGFGDQLQVKSYRYCGRCFGFF